MDLCAQKNAAQSCFALIGFTRYGKESEQIRVLGQRQPIEPVLGSLGLL